MNQESLIISVFFKLCQAELDKFIFPCELVNFKHIYDIDYYFYI